VEKINRAQMALIALAGASLMPEFGESGHKGFGKQSRVSASSKKREGPKVGRNEQCPCGSGKKFKKCCLK
jgi:preprotein translocase subunit SecA